MNGSTEFDKTEVSDIAVIQFGNFVDRLLILSFFSPDQHYEFPLNARFRDILKVLKRRWRKNPFSILSMQDPETIESLLREFHEYNLLPLPPEPLIRRKITMAEKFYRYLDHRFAQIFRGSQLAVVESTLEDYTRDAFTGELLPPLGLMARSELSPSDRAQVNKATSQGGRRPSKIREGPVKAIKGKYPVHRIWCECCDEWIPCPNCGLTDLLRGWGLQERTIALCYNCGVLFFADTGEVIIEFDGDREFWGARAIGIVGSLK